jgi:hypothetical protein
VTTNNALVEVEEPNDVWDHQSNEPPRGYAAFRIYRDLPPIQRNLARVADTANVSERRLRSWAQQWNWRERAEAWDDACHQLEDRERLEAIREMHSVHRKAGRLAIDIALRALGALDPHSINPTTIARLMELGAKLERSTLIVSVEELQGIETIEESDDPWDRIARELDPATNQSNGGD